MNIIVENIKQAILRGDKVIGDRIALPTPQRTGTFTQQNSYALLKAREIFETHFKNKLRQDKTPEEKFEQMMNNFETP
ncbi:MAG: hypothetical protein GKR88_15385 [Flavobacteriaceae bacterium]|nr:MAG: hypothetical protein GKR88_15385 [Flavobacteriaceae bacterium]